MSHLTAAEILDSGEIASLPKRWTISLSGGERCSWRSRRLVCPTSNRSHLVSHPFSEGKHLRQRWRDRRVRNPLSGPLRTIMANISSDSSSSSTAKACSIQDKTIRDGKYLARHMPVLGNVHPIKPRFHVSANANVIRKRKRNHHLTLSVIMSSVFPCIRFN